MRYAMQGEYIIWIMVSTIGLLQALASRYGWTGLSFFRRQPRLGYLCAAILVPGSYYWFFSYQERNVPGLEGWQLFSRFLLGAAAGIVLVLALSSLVNARSRLQPGTDPAHAGDGLDALRSDTYARLLAGLIAGVLSRWRLPGTRGGAEHG